MAQTGGGVRSLLARFENNNANNNNKNINNSTSPPSRGRSPIGSENSASGRPLSKVRASFVAVERGNNNNNNNNNSGQGVSTSPFLRDSPAKPRTVTGADDAGSPIQKSVGLASTGNGNSNNNGALDERMLSSSRPALSRNKSTGDDSTNAPSGEVVQELGKILKGSPFEDSTPPGNSADSKQSSSPPASNASSKLQREPDPAASIANGKPKEPTSPKKTTTTSARVSNVVGTQDSPAHKQARDKSPAKDQKAPAFPRTPKTPSESTTHTAPKPAAAKPTKEPDKLQPKVAKKQPSRASLNPTATKPASRPQTQTQTSATSRDAPAKQAASNHTKPSTDNNKPRTKSPTLPARLPSSLMTPTASSAAKLNPNAGTNKPPSRPASRNNNTTTTTSRTITRKPSSLKPDQKNTTTVRKQPSRNTLSAPRPSSTATHDRPRSRVSNVSNNNSSSRAPDESFLARMMRPTASSASKAHEKLEIKSPPRPTPAGGNKHAHARGAPRSSMGSRRTNHTNSPTRSVGTQGSPRSTAAAEPERGSAAHVEEESVPVPVPTPVQESDEKVEEGQEQGELSVVEEAPIAATPAANGGPEAGDA